MLLQRLLPLILCTLAACGGDDEAPPQAIAPPWDGDAARVAGGIVRLELEGTNPDYEVGDIEPYRAFRVTGSDLPGSWKLPQGCEPVHETRPAVGGDWHGLRFNEKGHLIVNETIDPAKFNRVIVELALTAKADLYLELRRKGKQLARSKMVRVAGTKKPQLAVLDVPETLALDGKADQLRLMVVPLGGKPAILGFDLVATPIGSWLPSVSAGLLPVPIIGQVRHAQGLSSRNPLRGKATVPPGAFLRFACGSPREVHRFGENLRVLAQVVNAAGKVIGTTRVRIQKGQRWFEGEIPLEIPEAGEYEVRFTLEGAKPGRESVVALASPRFERRITNPPAILLVTSDTHRADHLGSGGLVSTPFLDRLGEAGVVFEDCLCAINITNPSHASILTGLSARDTGVTDNVTALSDSAVTLAEQFQKAGYYTIASLSAKHMNHDQSGLGQGFDQLALPAVAGQIDSPTAIAPIVNWLEESSGRPLFVWLHVFDAHAPYEVPESHRYLYYDKNKDPYDPDLPPLQGRATVQWDRDLRDPEYLIAQYRSEVTYLDEQLAAALAHDRLGEALIAVTSDHGEHFGSHGLYWTHQGLYPETLAVPLILSWPNGPTGVRVSEPVDQLDLGRTLLDLADLGWVEFPGENLLRFVEGDEEPGPRYAIGSHGKAASISHDGWYLVLNLQPHGSPPRKAHQVELYRPAEDPTCQNDLVDAEFEKARQLRAMLIAWLDGAPRQTLSRRSDVSDPEVLAQMAALGYATDIEVSDDAARLFVPDPKNPWDRRFE